MIRFYPNFGNNLCDHAGPPDRRTAMRASSTTRAAETILACLP
jgi:hypothetical protein